MLSARSLSRLVALFVVVSVLATLGLGQEGNWSLGSKAFYTTADAAAPLAIKSVGATSLRSYAFVGKVGGVNFEQVATWDSEANGRIGLRYTPSLRDGARLSVTIGEKEHRMELPDWQLKPIADFANSDHTAAVSLFGEGVDRENYFYIQFHEAFKDTLLGMRLLQADIILMDPFGHSEMPKLGGRVILGEGEEIPERMKSLGAAMKIGSIFGDHSFSAWVLTDTDQPIRVALTDGDLDLNGEPYFHFWKLNESSVAKRDEMVREYDQAVDRYNRLVRKHWSAVAAQDRGQAEALESKLSALEQSLKESELRIQDFEPEVEFVLPLINGLKSRPELLDRLNQPVFEAVRRTSRYGALFRYVKANDPAAWSQFVRSIRNVEVTPAVVTPTKWEK